MVSKKWIVEKPVTGATSGTQSIPREADILKIDNGCLVFFKKAGSQQDKFNDVVLNVWAPGTWLSCKLEEQTTRDIEATILAYVKAGRSFTSLEAMAADLKLSELSIDWELVRLLNADKIPMGWVAIPAIQEKLNQFLPDMLARHPRADYKNLKEMLSVMTGLRTVTFCQIAHWKKVNKK